MSEYLKDNLDNWGFDVFHFEKLAGGTPLRYLSFELFRKHNLIKKFEVHNYFMMMVLLLIIAQIHLIVLCTFAQIQGTRLDAFLVAMENGYHHHDNPYHNSTHATDVVQTLHYFLSKVGTYEVSQQVCVCVGGGGEGEKMATNIATSLLSELATNTDFGILAEFLPSP